jgi:hypothetical protein
MFGREPRLPIDIQFNLTRESDDSHTYTEYVKKLRDRLSHAFELTAKHSKSAQGKQTDYYNKKMRGGALHIGDTVLVRNKHVHFLDKLADLWEEEPHTVLQKPYADLPVYTVRAKSGGRKRTLHRNMLMPITGDEVDSISEDSKEAASEDEDEEVDSDHAQMVIVLEQNSPTHTEAQHVTENAQPSSPDHVQITQSDIDNRTIDSTESPGNISLEEISMEIEDTAMPVSIPDTHVITNDSIHEEHSPNDTSLDNSDLADTGDSNHASTEPVPEMVVLPENLVTEEVPTPPRPALRRSTRVRLKPAWLTSGDWRLNQLLAVKPRLFYPFVLVPPTKPSK